MRSILIVFGLVGAEVLMQTVEHAHAHKHAASRPNHELAQNLEKLKSHTAVGSSEALEQVESVLMTAADPATTANVSELTIVSKVMKQIVDFIDIEHQADVASLNTAKGVVNRCTDEWNHGFSTTTSPKGIVIRLQTQASGSKSIHSSCRTVQKTLQDLHNSNVSETTTWLSNLESQSCPATPNSWTYDHAKTYFHSAFATWFLTHRAEFVILEANQNAAQGLATDKRDQCNTNQATYESEYCQYMQVHNVVCRTYDDCYTEAKADYNQDVNDVAARVSTRKMIYQAVHYVNCTAFNFIELHNDPSITLPACNANIDASQYNITPPGHDGPQPCTKITLAPTTGTCTDWKTAKYGDLHSSTPPADCTSTCLDVTAKQKDSSCTDLDDGITDTKDDNCDWYAGHHHVHCGQFDDADFVANVSCCSCNGGLTPAPTAAPTPAPTVAPTEAPTSSYPTKLIDGKTYHLWWWFNKDSVWPASKTDVFGDNYGDCSPDDAICFSKLPPDLQEHGTELLAIDNLDNQLLWTFDQQNEVSRVAWQAMHDGKEGSSLGSSHEWKPTALKGTGFTTRKQDCAIYEINVGIKSFSLDDDTHWCHTTLEMGVSRPQSSTPGVDNLADNGCSTATTHKGLHIYFRQAE